MRPLGDQVVLVTGSTDGLGKHVAAELAARGAYVIVHGRDPARTEAAAREVGAGHELVFSFELAERLGAPEVSVNALHPATLMDTNMVRENFGGGRSTVEEGGRAVIRLIADPGLDGVSGRFYDGLSEGTADPQAYEPEARRRLWQLSEELTGVRVPV